MNRYSRKSCLSRYDSGRFGASSLGELRSSPREICLQPDHDQDIVDTEYQGVVSLYEKRSTKDRNKTNRRGERDLSECSSNDR